MGAGKTDPELRRRLSDWTRYLLEEYRLTQEQMAKRMGVAQPTISQALSGRKTVGLDFLVKLHKAFYKSADMFIDSDPPPRNAQHPGASRDTAAPERHGSGSGRG